MNGLQARWPDECKGRWIFPLLLLATLPQNFYDLSAIFAGEPLALYTYQGPIVYKLGKDFVYLLLLGVGAWDAVRRNRSPIEDFSFLIVLLIGTQAVLSALFNGPFVAIIGIRWALPFLLFFWLRHWAIELDTRAAAFWVLAGLGACLGAQLVQLVTMPPVFGELLPGVPARTPGIFVVPNTSAFFGCSSAACILAFPRTTTLQRGLAVFGAVLVCALAQSGTGVVVSMLLALWWLTSRRPWAFWMAAVLAFGVVFPNLEYIIQREQDYLLESGGGRLDVLIGVVTRAIASIQNFGLYTNAANLQADNPADQIAVDSLVASWIGNFGATSLLVLGLVGLFAAFRMSEIDWRRAAPCLLVLVLFSMTTIVFEAFPMNIYLVLGIWAARRSQPAFAVGRYDNPMTAP